jgi:hypothetical protein
LFTTTFTGQTFTGLVPFKISFLNYLSSWSRATQPCSSTGSQVIPAPGSEGTTSSVSPIDIEQATGSSGYYSEESDTSTNAYWDPHGRFSKNTEDDTKTIVPIEGLMESEKVRDDIHADLLVKKPTVDVMKKGINDNIGKMVKNLEVIHAIKSQAGCSISADQTQVSRRSKTADTPGQGQASTRRPAPGSSAQPRDQDVATHSGLFGNVGNIAGSNNVLSHDKSVKKRSIHKTGDRGIHDNP